MQFSRRGALLSITSLLTTASFLAAANTFPDKPVKIFVGFAAGGAADIVARQLGAKLGEQTGQTFIVDNKPGATGTVAATAAARSPADGYSLLLTSQSTMVVAPAIYPKLGFDPVKDLTPLTMLVNMPMLLVVHPSVSAKTVQELMAMIKGGKDMAYASAGAGGPQHMAAELFASMGKFKLTHVPYKGEAPALTDLLGGQVQLMFANLPAVMPYMQSDKLRVLAISSAKRHPSLPNLPTLAEAASLPNYDVQTWYGLFTSAGTPAPIVKKLQDETSAALKSTDLARKLTEQGFTIIGDAQPDFKAFIKTEVPRWAKLIKEANIRVD